MNDMENKNLENTDDAQQVAPNHEAAATDAVAPECDCKTENNRDDVTAIEDNNQQNENREEQNETMPETKSADAAEHVFDEQKDENAQEIQANETVAEPAMTGNPYASAVQPPVHTRQNYYQANQMPYQQNMYQQNMYAYPQGQEAAVQKKSKGKAAFLAIACVLFVLAIGIFTIVITTGLNSSGNSDNGLRDVPHVSAVSSAESNDEALSAAEVYQKVFKSSVSILAYKQNGGELGVLGSGVICQEDTGKTYTYIVTCAHVINDPSYNIKVELWDGTVHTAEVVNYDDSNDIGVVRIKATGLQIAEFGDSDDIQPGATVYAIGSPYSSKFAGTFTRGMVSAVNRLVTTQTSYQLCCIQHDTPINNGNSGGALLNAYGQVIGINALKITAEGYEGLGFSVPSTTVIKVINSIIETGLAPKAPKLGISYVQAIYYSQFLSDLIEENNLPAGSIVVADINDDSSLKDTELQENDIITAVNGQDLTTPDLLVQLIQNSQVGDSFELSVARIIMNEDGTDYVDIETFTVTAVLVEKTDADQDSASDDAQEDFYNYFGDDSGSYEDFYEYFYDYFYGQGGSGDGNNSQDDDNRFSIPE